MPERAEWIDPEEYEAEFGEPPPIPDDAQFWVNTCGSRLPEPGEDPRDAGWHRFDPRTGEYIADE